MHGPIRLRQNFFLAYYTQGVFFPHISSLARLLLVT